MGFVVLGSINASGSSTFQVEVLGIIVSEDINVY